MTAVSYVLFKHKRRGPLLCMHGIVGHASITIIAHNYNQARHYYVMHVLIK